MTEPSPARPVPGTPPPGPRPGGHQAATGSPAEGDTRPEGRFDDLTERPIAEHVAVFETEHARLERELGTIDHV